MPRNYGKKWAAAILLLATISFFSWGASSPAGSSPDDDFHLTSIWCAQGERSALCENITDSMVSVPQLVSQVACYAGDKSATDRCQSAMSYDFIETTRVNNLERTYPGGYYWLLSWFSSPNIQFSVFAMKLANTLIFVLCLALTLFCIRPTLRRPLVLSVILTIVPLGMFLIPSTNPSSWVLYSPLFVYFLARDLGGSRHKTVSTIQVSSSLVLIATIACIARSDAAFFVSFAFVLGAISEWGNWAHRKVFFVVGFFVLSVCFLSALVGSQISAASTGVGDPDIVTSKGTWGLLLRNFVDLPSLYVGVFGGSNLGWMDTPMPSFVWVSQTLIFGALLLVCVSALRSRPAYIAVVVALIAMITVPLEVLQASGAPVGVLVQPRYVLPLLALTVAALITEGIDRLINNRLLFLACLIVVACANSIALTTNILRYSLGLGSTPTFSELTPLVLVIALVGTIAFGGTLLLPYKWFRQFSPVDESDVTV